MHKKYSLITAATGTLFGATKKPPDLALAAHSLVSLDESVFMVHHDPMMLFAFGVEPKCDPNTFGL